MTDISLHIQQFEEIENVHDLHIWTVDGIYNVLTAHVVLYKSLPMDKLAELKEGIRTKMYELGIEHITIEFETTDEKCTFENCCNC